jgi:divalent metal cation (Fe/Co/Zn/Cd) transporter
VHLLDCYEDDRLKTSDTEAISNNDCDSDTSSREKDAFVAKIVFIVNVCLLFTKIVASYLSDSLSIISTVLDTVMDLISGGVVWMTMRAIMSSKPYMYPRGRTRLEPISVIIVSILMGIGNLIMIFESVSSIINKTVSSSLYRVGQKYLPTPSNF